MAEGVSNNPEIEQTWKKVRENALKAGYREGITDGKETNYQGNFDEGCRNGFKLGFTLGIYKGILNCHQIDEKELLQNVRRGNCEMCTNKQFINEDISTLVQRQIRNTSSLLDSLKKKYPVVNDYDLPN